MAHSVDGARVRAEGVQNVFHTMREEFLPYIGEAVDNLPAEVDAAIARGETVWAEQMLRSQEAMVGIITHEQFASYMQQASTEGNTGIVEKD